jgi:tRNA (cmo5U34)-methyltransferase
LVRSALGEFPKTRFILADPSQKMLKAAEEKIPRNIKSRVSLLPPTGSAGLANHLEGRKADVVTAIQCHHYLSLSERFAALRSCWEILFSGGLLVVFENIAPETPRGVQVGLKRWASYQMGQGKTRAQAARHVRRYGKEFFPITPQAHLESFRKSGFRAAELFWLSYLQAGFYAIK